MSAEQLLRTVHSDAHQAYPHDTARSWRAEPFDGSVLEVWIEAPSDPMMKG